MEIGAHESVTNDHKPGNIHTSKAIESASTSWGFEKSDVKKDCADYACCIAIWRLAESPQMKYHVGPKKGDWLLWDLKASNTSIFSGSIKKNQPTPGGGSTLSTPSHFGSARENSKLLCQAPRFLRKSHIPLSPCGHWSALENPHAGCFMIRVHEGFLSSGDRPGQGHWRTLAQFFRGVP